MALLKDEVSYGMLVTELWDNARREKLPSASVQSGDPFF
jgi:hypothetical protein